MFSLILSISVSRIYSLAFSSDNSTIYEKEKVSSNTGTCVISEYVLALQHDCGFESIHGLWPDPEATCTTCTSETFSESKLSSTTLSNMNSYWPTCQSGTNHDFWSHEWSKHGTCSGMTQDSYFSKAISLYNSYKSKCTTTCKLCFTATFGYKGLC
jgi:ribonuclease T2